MKKLSIVIHDYNLEALEDGLNRVGKSLDDFSDEEIGTMMSYALGFCDFNNESVIKDLLNEIE